MLSVVVKVRAPASAGECSGRGPQPGGVCDLAGPADAGDEQEPSALPPDMPVVDAVPVNRPGIVGGL